MSDLIPTYQLLLKYEYSRRRRRTTLREFAESQEVRRDPILQLELVALDIEIRLQLGERVDVSGYMLEFPHLAEKLILVYEEVKQDFLKNFCPLKHKFDCLPDDFAGYEIQHEVGRGGMGVVYQAIQINTQTVCAIKVFFFKHNDVAKEASILSKIDHPNVCQLLGWSEHHSLPYICIELVTGQTIDELVNQRGKLNALETARFVREIALGLQTIHDLEIIHFDVTTKNIVISNIGVPCLIDFGLATRTPEGADTLPFQAIGTFQFMPPEMLDRRFGEPGKQCDIYSLGVVMYTMLTGYNPFQVLDVDALGQICTHPAPHPNDFENVDIDPELESICLKTLQKHVHNRTSGTRQLIGELDAWIEKANSSA